MQWQETNDVRDIDIKTDPRFAILNIADQLNIKIVGQSGVEKIGRCPFCGDSDNPKSGHLYLNTATNQYYCVLCGKGGYAVGLYANLLGISNFDAICKIANENTISYSPPMRPLYYKENDIAPIEERNAVYSALLKLLTLDSSHIENLIKRGLSLQHITQKGYRSIPPKEKAVYIAKKLLDMGLHLNGIPGFFKKGKEWTFVTYHGLLIPVRDYRERIQGLQVRLDNVNTGRKYRWFSSLKMARHGGTRAMSWVHTAKGQKNITIITEGPLKADVAAFLSGTTFVGVPGVNAISEVETAISSIPAENRQQIFIAYDMDMLTNKHVLNARRKLVARLNECFPKTKISLLSWPLKHGKGIDDFYYNLKKGLRLTLKEKWDARQCLAIAQN